jgi:HK97 family phage major capsid protein
MTHQTPARPRGLVGRLRAEGATPAAAPQEILSELNRTFEAFRQKNDEHLEQMQARFDDVVTREEAERINAEVGNLTAALETANAQIAQLEIGGAIRDMSRNPANREHTEAFRGYFTRGAEAGLRDLEVRAELTTQSDPDGGYLVPHEVEQGIDQILRTVSVIRQLASSTTIAGSTWSKYVNMGGATYEWVGEESARSETTTPTLREMRLDAHELSAMPVTTQWMLDDGAFDVAGWLADEVQESFAEAENAAFISGDGNKKPTGILSYDWVENDSWEWGKLGYKVSGDATGFIAPTSSASPADCLIDVHGSLKQQARPGAVWMMNDKTMHTVRKFKDGQGNYIWAPPSTAADVPTILAKPVYSDDNMPDVGAGETPILFGNFPRSYRIIDRMGIRVLRDALTTKGKVKFYTTKRVGGGLIHFQYMKGLRISA